MKFPVDAAKNSPKGGQHCSGKKAADQNRNQRVCFEFKDQRQAPTHMNTGERDVYPWN